MRANRAAPAPAVLTDVELTTLTEKLVTEYKHRLHLDDWHTEIKFDPAMQVAGHSLYAWDKREALITFRTEMMRRDGARLLPYVVAHELAHLVLSELDTLRDRILIGQNGRMTLVILEHWKYVEEGAVHKIALSLPGVTPPDASFWWDPFNDGNPE